MTRREWIMFGLCVAIWTGCALFWVTRVAAQDGSEWAGSRMALHPGDGPCFAIVSIDNISGVYNNTEALETEHGVVSIRYETVGGHNATDFDLVDVVDLPAGVMADPMHIALPDGEVGFVCLMEWTGG